MAKKLYYFDDFKNLGLEDIATRKIALKEYQNLEYLRKVRDDLVKILKKDIQKNDPILAQKYERIIEKYSGSPEAGFLSSILLMSADQESKEKFMEIATKEDYGFLGLKADFLSHIKLETQAMFAQVKEVEFCLEGFLGNIEVEKFSNCGENCGYYSSGKIGELYKCSGNSFLKFQGCVGLVKECDEQVLKNAKITKLNTLKYSSGMVLKNAGIGELEKVFFCNKEVLKSAKINNLKKVIGCCDLVLYEAFVNKLGEAKFLNGNVGKFLKSGGVEYIANIKKGVFSDMEGKVQHFDEKNILGKFKAMAFSNKYLRNNFFN